MPDKDQLIEMLYNTIAMLNSQIATLTALVEELRAKLEASGKENEELRAKLEAYESMLKDLGQKLDAANEKSSELMDGNIRAMKEMALQLETISALTEQVKALQEKQSLNSGNSSKPPSSDGLRKKNVNKDRSLRESSGKKQGGQPGHKGTTFMETREADDTKQHLPGKCEKCPHKEECLKSAKILEKRRVVDIKVETKITEHQLICVKDCPLCHQKLTGKFPEEIKAPLQYGDSLSALVTALNTLGAVSMNRIKEILGNVFNIPLSTGTISSMVSRAARKVGSALDVIREKLVNCDVTHSDETGFRVDGKTRWAHVLCTDSLTCLNLSDFRGHKGMEEMGLLPQYKGINVHDCWASYWKYPEITHAVCNAHILRELKYVADNYPDQTWNIKFRALLLDMKSEKEKALAEGKQELSEELKKKFMTEYDEIIRLAYKENPMPADDKTKPGKRGRKKKGKVRSLIERLATNKEAVCLFAMDFRVPFDNNQAERDLRCIKIKSKVSGSFRTREGAQEYLDIMSYLSTARKLGFNGHEAMFKAYQNDACYIFA